MIIVAILYLKQYAILMMILQHKEEIWVAFEKYHQNGKKVHGVNGNNDSVACQSLPHKK